MSQLEIAKNIIALYERHGWRLQRVLLTPASRAQEINHSLAVFGDSPVVESDFDALWFARPSTARREAWELRLISEQAYALFEAFEADEGEDARQEVRQEMENKMREYARR